MQQKHLALRTRPLTVTKTKELIDMMTRTIVLLDT